MNLNELVKKYDLLQDEEGRYYKLDKFGNRIEPYLTINVLSKCLDQTRHNIKKKIDKVLKFYKINPHYGPICKFYNLNDVLVTCSDLLIKIPIANRRGIALIEGKKYANIRTLSKMLRISIPSIVERAKKLNSKIIKGERKRLSSAFDIELIKIVCSDLLQKAKTINKAGFAIINGKKYANAKKLAKMFELAEARVYLYIKNNKIKSKKIKLHCGRLVNGYEVNKIKKLYANIVNIPQADENGVAYIRGEEYASIYVISKKMGIHYSSVQTLIENKRLISCKIRLIRGQIREAYSIRQVKSTLPFLFDKLPLANKRGIAVIDGEEYATISTLTKLWNYGEKAIRQRVFLNKLKSKKIRRTASTIYEAYKINDVKKALSDILHDSILANKEGVAIIGGEKYATIGKIAQMYNVDSGALRKRLQLLNINPRKIRLPGGQIYDGYRINFTKMICGKIERRKKIKPVSK